MNDPDDFILPVTTRSATRASLEAADKRPCVGDNNRPVALDEQRAEPGPDAERTEASGEPSAQSGLDADDASNTTTGMSTGVGNHKVSDPPVHADNAADQGIHDIQSVVFPTIASRDYLTDDEFGDIYRYLDSDELTGNARKDRTILLKAERYLIDDNGLLYKMDIPRQKKLARLKPIIKKLCVPLRYRHDMLAFVHDKCGHYATQSLFQTLALRFFLERHV